MANRKFSEAAFRLVAQETINSFKQPQKPTDGDKKKKKKVKYGY